MRSNNALQRNGHEKPWPSVAESLAEAHISWVAGRRTAEQLKVPFLGEIPLDPITGNSQSWQTVMEDSLSMVDQTAPGIFDIRSGAQGRGLDGTQYAEW